ncbi:MAG: ATPase, T2SS/T4P/T4SS family [Armatimonadota bacterium]|nr:ATPase, T2SS/T4P/T4SS family [Armatimonadota bacterium]
MDNVETLNFLPLYDVSDYTVFPSDKRRMAEILGDGKLSRNRSAWRDTDSGRVQLRICACKCYGGKRVSVTVRWKKQNEAPKYRRRRRSNLSETTYWPQTEDFDHYWFGLGDIAALISQCTLELGLAERHGVIAIAGATNCGKSQLARALVAKTVDLDLSKRKTGRRPHLVTIEDPIEEYYAKPDAGGEPSPEAAKKIGVDYTPRELHVDTKSLRDGLQDALRQTPTVVYVGEIRDRSDWLEIFKFAGSGHLIVTTTHASTLVEAMDSILKAHGAKTPAQRKYVASRILAVVQLRPYAAGGKTALLPEMWRRTTKGINDLVADGLASVLPNCPVDEPDSNLSSFGRAWFARELRIRPENHKIDADKVNGIRSAIADQAVVWDLLQE